MISPVPNSFALVPTNSYEIIDIALRAKYTRKEGPDNIDPLVAQKTIGAVAEIISQIINSSFETGEIPPDLKTARITPIFKQGDKTDD